MEEKPFVYLDNAATTAIHPKVLEAMKPFLMEDYSNPASVYQFAQKTHKVLEECREIIADYLKAKPEEVYFTSGGSESDNWAVKGVAYSLKEKGKHIITSKIEHHAVLNTCRFLERQGFEVTYLDVDEDGLISLKALEAAIRPDTILITIMAANNEIGTVQPVREIGAIARKYGVLFHTDAVQAFAHIPLDVEEDNIDLLSASGHKFHGPKGVGFLYIRNGVKIQPLIHGGAQERSRRGGTHNMPGIVGMTEAVKQAFAYMTENTKKEEQLRDYLINRVEQEIPYVRLNGHRTRRLPNNVNISFRFIEGESLLIMLDQKGICGSSGSACTSGSLEPSHVLLGIGLPHEIAHGSLRLTLSERNTKEELDYTVDSLKQIVGTLRSMSPLYEDFIEKEADKVD